MNLQKTFMFGFMYGLGPRGVVQFEGKLVGDNLSGTNRFAAINFREPDASSPPPLHFSFKRGGVRGA
jgi:hypothetical protein